MRGHHGFPMRQGLYDPGFERDSCGVGFVCSIKGIRSNTIVRHGIEILNRLAHRGAVGADPKTGDGAGMLVQIPHEFFKKAAAYGGISLPDPGSYGTGMVFMPQDSEERRRCKEIFEKVSEEEGQVFLGWRTVPVDDSAIGRVAKLNRPVFEQMFIKKGGECDDEVSFERKLYIIRRRVENIVLESKLSQGN